MDPDIRWKQRFQNYDSAVFEKATEAIASHYLPAMGALHEFFKREVGR